MRSWARIWVCAFIIVLLPSQALQAREPDRSEIEQRFVEALRLIENDEYRAGIERLEALMLIEPTPRLRLELARAHFLAGNLSASRALFIEASEQNPPPAVAYNIRSFIQEIDRRRGKWELSFSAQRYSNPLQEPEAFQFDFSGIPLTYQPDREYRNVWGAELGASYSKRVAQSAIARGSISYREIEGELADRLLVSGGLQRSFANGRGKAGTSGLLLRQSNQSYLQGRAEVSYEVPLGGSTVVVPSISTYLHDSLVSSDLSGFGGAFHIPLAHRFSSGNVIFGGPVLGLHTVATGDRSYTFTGVRSGGQFRQGRFTIAANAQFQLTRFNEVDSFWGATRRDQSLATSVQVSNADLTLAGLTPTVSISCYLRSSNIAYFDYGSCDWGLGLKKEF